MLPEEYKLRTVQVRTTANDILVTALEILSPVNKRGDGLALYRAKPKACYGQIRISLKSICCGQASVPGGKSKSHRLRVSISCW